VVFLYRIRDLFIKTILKCINKSGKGKERSPRPKRLLEATKFLKKIYIFSKREMKTEKYKLEACRFLVHTHVFLQGL
jgi:hypothetical protein